MSEMSVVQTTNVLGPVTATAPKIPAHLLCSFTSVVYHKSVSHAATVQCVPYVQMAQQIARLESLIGTAVIDPKPGPFSLTKAGKALNEAVAPHIAEAELQVQATLPRLLDAKPEKPAIKVGLGVWGLAALLKPYVHALQGIDCSLNFVPQSRLEASTPDVICYLGKSPRPGYEIETLFGEEMITVCSANYPVPDGGYDGSTLRYEPLLQLGHEDHSDDWHSFLGLDPEKDLPGIGKDAYSSFSTYLKAIKAGRGVGVGLAPLFANELASGTLQLASDRRVWRNRSVFLGVAKDSEFKGQAREFADVLRQAIGAAGTVATWT